MGFDTGSQYTFLYNDKMMTNLPRAQGWFVPRWVGGMRESLATPQSVTSSDASRVNFAGFDGMILEKWVRHWISIGSLRWFRKIAVARIPVSEMDF